LGATEDIEWLNQDEGGLKRIFLIVAEKDGRSVREIKEAYGQADWWIVKGYLKLLSDRGLIAEDASGRYRTTESGSKVAGNLKALKYIPEVV